MPDGFTHVEGTDLDNGYTIQDSKENKYVLSLDRTDFSRDGIIHKNIIDWLLEK